MKLVDNELINGGLMNGISVVISTYDDPIEFVSQCVHSILCQEKVYEIVVVDSSKKGDIKKLCQNIKIKNDKINYIYTPPRGLSDARNKGVEISKKDIVAFTDSDCIVDKNWADNLLRTFDKDVAIVGGKILPKWLSIPNKILYNSAIAQGFYSSFDMGEETKMVDQIFGANFAINKKLIDGQFFSLELGRSKGDLLCGEEINLCKRTREKGLKIMYNNSAIVWHQIPDERSKFKWIWKRMYYGGITRAILGGRITPKTVNFIKYNMYDIIFLLIFTLPYIYGFCKGLRMGLRMGLRIGLRI